jgi:hypothetical protein
MRIVKSVLRRWAWGRVRYHCYRNPKSQCPSHTGKSYHPIAIPTDGRYRIRRFVVRPYKVGILNNVCMGRCGGQCLGIALLNSGLVCLHVGSIILQGEAGNAATGPSGPGPLRSRNQGLLLGRHVQAQLQRPARKAVRCASLLLQSPVPIFNYTLMNGPPL